MNTIETVCWFMYGKPWIRWRDPVSKDEDKFVNWYIQVFAKIWIEEGVIN